MTRQNYYAKRRRRGAAEADTGLVAELARRERETQPRIGGRKLRVLLRAGLEEAGVRIGRDRFFAALILTRFSGHSGYGRIWRWRL